MLAIPPASTATEKAPTARPIPAWGEAPCWITPDTQGLKARPIASIPQVPLVAFHPILLQKRAKLILIRALTMVRLLRVDILDECLQIGWPDGKRSIPSLPRELSQSGRFCLEPLRRRSLQLCDQLRYIRRSRQTDCQMHMVRDTSDAVAFAASVTDDRSKVRIQFRTNRIVQSGSASLRTEDHMHHNERERQWHRHEYRSGLQPSPVTRNTTWGETPCRPGSGGKRDHAC